MQRHPGIYLTLIIAVAILAAVFIYPAGFGKEFRPWRLGLDLVGGTHLVYEVDLSKVSQTDQDSVLNGLRDVVERRVNAFGVSEPQVYIAKTAQGSQLDVELAGVHSISDAIKQIGETPFLIFAKVDPNASGTDAFTFTNLTGEYVTGAQLTFDQTTQQPQVALTFNDQGGQIFERMTADLAELAKTQPDPYCKTGGQAGRRLAIFLDNTPISVPCVYSSIPGGSAVITGNFTVDEAKQLVERLNAGALPAPIKLVDQLTVNPSLGADSLNKGIIAGLAGTLLVMLFMVGYYRKLGIFAALSLIIYIALTLAVFKLVPITLTLAGLAGFVLTIGMAVDANILIFERIKEEMARGLSRSAALTEGFRRAWPSIRDSNSSTIITAVILYFFTSSFVKGFALTLLLGVLISLFSAITTTRLFLAIFLKERQIKA